jgi:hypothetical protein
LSVIAQASRGMSLKQVCVRAYAPTHTCFKGFPCQGDYLSSYDQTMFI